MGYQLSRTNSCGFLVLSNSLLSNISQLTVSAWIYATWPNPSGTQRIFLKGTNNASENGRMLYLNNDSVSSGGSIIFQINPSITQMIVQASQGSVTLNKWINVSATWDGTLTATGTKVFVNGTESLTYATRQNGAGTIDDSPYHVYIGNFSNYGRILSGSMCELAVWSTTLNSQEILSLANSRIKRTPLQIRPDKLVMFFPMDETPDGGSTTINTNTIFDITSNGFVGISTSGAGGSAALGIAEQVLSYQ